jgi:hypothetical protein
MTDYSPFSGRRATAAPPRLARTLWTMRSAIGKEIVAGIYDVMTGRELRITLGDHLLESQLSRTADAPLEQRASDVLQLLESRGWSRAESIAETVEHGSVAPQASSGL